VPVIVIVKDRGELRRNQRELHLIEAVVGVELDLAQTQRDRAPVDLT